MNRTHPEDELENRLVWLEDNAHTELKAVYVLLRASLGDDFEEVNEIRYRET